MWLGQSSIAGKTILIYADEGMGDAIQLARYLPMVAGLGATVILVVHPALRPLLSGVAGVRGVSRTIRPKRRRRSTPIVRC